LEASEIINFFFIIKYIFLDGRGNSIKLPFSSKKILAMEAETYEEEEKE
jgi:hypothetical protein